MNCPMCETASTPVNQRADFGDAFGGKIEVRATCQYCPNCEHNWLPIEEEKRVGNYIADVNRSRAYGRQEAKPMLRDMLSMSRGEFAEALEKAFMEGISYERFKL